MRLLRFVVVLASMFAASAWAGPSIFISALKGNVSLVSHGKQIVPKVQSAVAIGDRITVGPDSWTTLRFSDGGSFTLRSGAVFTVDRYQYSGQKPEPKDGMFVSLFKGSMRAISGLVSKKNHVNYAIRTPTATIGVRGTDHDVVVVTEGENSGTEPGTYDKVNDGETVLQTPQGEVHVLKGQVASAPLMGGLPRLLDRVPKMLERIEDEDLRNGIQEHLKAIHEMMEDGTFKNTLQGMQELRNLRGKPGSEGERKKILNKMLDDMSKDD